MLSRFKVQIQSLLKTEARLLHNIGVTPNQISFTGICFAFLAGSFLWGWQRSRLFLIVAPILFLISGLCDVLDGMVARLYSKTTVFGGFLDSLLDRYADAFIFVAIMVSGLSDIFWSSAALIGSLLVSYTRARAEAAGAEMETVGFAERAERVIILTVASFATFFWVEAFNWSMIILAVLTNLTVLQRTIYFYRASKQKMS